MVVEKPWAGKDMPDVLGRDKGLDMAEIKEKTKYRFRKYQCQQCITNTNYDTEIGVLPNTQI